MRPGNAGRWGRRSNRAARSVRRPRRCRTRIRSISCRACRRPRGTPAAARVWRRCQTVSGSFRSGIAGQRPAHDSWRNPHGSQVFYRPGSPVAGSFGLPGHADRSLLACLSARDFHRHRHGFLSAPAPQAANRGGVKVVAADREAAVTASGLLGMRDVEAEPALVGAEPDVGPGVARDLTAVAGSGSSR